MAVKNATTSLLMLQLLLADALLASLAERRLPPPLLPAGGRLHPHYNLNRVLDLASRINRTLAAVSTASVLSCPPDVLHVSRCFSTCVVAGDLRGGRVPPG